MADEIGMVVRALSGDRNADHDIARARQPADHDLQRREQRGKERCAVARRGLAQVGEKRRIERRGVGCAGIGPLLRPRPIRRQLRQGRDVAVELRPIGEIGRLLRCRCRLIPRVLRE